MTKTLLVFVFVFLIAAPTLAQTATPTPGPTPTLIIPSVPIDNAVHDANQGIATLDAPIDSPDGRPLVPDENGAALFGYIKWLVSPPVGDELAGPFGPFMAMAGILLTMEIATLGVYIALYIIVYGLRWAIAIFKFILLLIQTVAAAASGVVGFLLGFIGL
jgi:hypothetical protein